ncbi:MAG: AtpZ/AtpI family protein [Chitinophagaceae bacterium]|nr:MAG: AtpZ/AtpI family protein [Chitinophagaceae bacterium]
MNKKDNSFLLKYAGMATQFLVAIAIGVYGGLQLDKWLKFQTPLAVWLLPLLIITGIIIKIIKDTSSKK